MSLSKSGSDRFVYWSLRACILAVAALAAFIVAFLWSETKPIVISQTLAGFFSAEAWNPTEGQFNLMPMIVASVLTTVLAVFIAGPIALFSAVYSQLYAQDSIRRFYRICIEVLAGIPSIVYGFWGLTVLVPFINSIHTPGASLLAGALILSIMILPTIALITESSFAAVPKSSINAAHALGLGRMRLFFAVIFPSCRGGILTAVLLGCGRAIGETMAMVMVCGNIVQIPQTVFDPIRTLPANIALEMAYASGAHRSSLFLSGLVLTGLVMIMMAIAHQSYREKQNAA